MWQSPPSPGSEAPSALEVVAGDALTPQNIQITPGVMKVMAQNTPRPFLLAVKEPRASGG